MWIEELFDGCKGHSFDLESSHLGSFLHLSRLTLAVMRLYVGWSVRAPKHCFKGASLKSIFPTAAT